MKNHERQKRILELIKEKKIDTQGEIADILNAEGFAVAQATISRDIKELGLIKAPSPKGKLSYVQAQNSENHFASKLMPLFKDAITDIKSSENMIVVKTISGFAAVVCEAIDMLDIKHILGTISGENTIFIVIDGKNNAEITVKQLKAFAAL